MPGTIQNLEILSVGTWGASTGKVKITDVILDQIVEAFSALQGSNIVKPHLKLGHEEAQKWFGQKQGIPTLGWVSRVWKAGTKLMADITDVPEAIIELIKAKRYHNVSSEVYLDASIELNGRTFASVLSAIALLGTEMPAAKDLAGLASALFQERADSVRDELTIFMENEMTTNPAPTYSKEQVDQLVEAAVAKAKAEATASFSAEIADLKVQLTAQTKRGDDAEAAVVKLSDDHVKAEAALLIEAAIKDGRMLPKQKEMAMAFLTAAGKNKVKLSDGSEKTPAMLFKDFIGMAGKQVNLKEKGGAEERDVSQYPTAAAEVNAKTKAALKADTSGKLSYATAMQQVLDADEDLKNRYALGEAE